MRRRGWTSSGTKLTTWLLCTEKRPACGRSVSRKQREKTSTRNAFHTFLLHISKPWEEGNRFTNVFLQGVYDDYHCNYCKSAGAPHSHNCQTASNDSHFHKGRNVQVWSFSITQSDQVVADWWEIVTTDVMGCLNNEQFSCSRYWQEKVCSIICWCDVLKCEQCAFGVN